jgi:glucuronate isomerase
MPIVASQNPFLRNQMQIDLSLSRESELGLKTRRFTKMKKESFSELCEFVNTVPMIDIHSHIDASHPHAGSPRDILFYHYIVTELRSAGMPLELISPDLPVDDAVENVLPFLPLIKNTSTFWYFVRMLKELYGFEDQEINKKNLKRLLEAVYEGSRQGERYKWVLGEKAKIEKTFLTVKYDEAEPKYDPKFFVGALRLDPFISNLDKNSIEGLGKATNASIESIDSFSDSLRLLFKKFSRCVAATASFQPEDSFTNPTRLEAEKAFKNLLANVKLTLKERQTLSSYALRLALRLAEESGLVFQVMLGAKRPVAGAAPSDYAITGFESYTISSLCPLFYEFAGLKFDVFTTTPLLSHQLAVVAKNYPNVYVSGYWWYAFYPTFIKQFLRERLQMLPRNKSNGFFSDAYVVEWSYAKSSMVRLQVATVLNEMLTDGYITMDLAKELAVDLLNRNPRSTYDLK